MELRDATEDDVASITEIYAHYVTHSIVTLEETVPDTSTMLARFRSQNASGLPYLVLTDTTADPPNVIAGFAYASPWSDRTGYRFTVSDSVYLRPEYCGRGLGQTLLKALLERLKVQVLRHVLGGMSAGLGLGIDQIPSCKFHSAFGFEGVARLKGVGVKFGQVVDVVWMQLELEKFRA